jgi:hypothetical protein
VNFFDLVIAIALLFTLPKKCDCPHREQGLQVKYYPQVWRFLAATEPGLACEGDALTLRRKNKASDGQTSQRVIGIFLMSNIPFYCKRSVKTHPCKEQKLI